MSAGLAPRPSGRGGVIPWPGTVTLSWLGGASVLVSRGTISPSLSVVMLRTALKASTKQAATAALAVRELVGGGSAISRRWFAVTAASRR